MKWGFVIHKVIIINFNKLKEELIDGNITFPSKFNLEVSNDFKTLPIMYWVTNMHKTPTRARFLVSSIKCSKKTLSKSVTKAFELIFKQIQSFHEKSLYYSDYKIFWVVENSKPVIDRLYQNKH